MKFLYSTNWFSARVEGDGLRLSTPDAINDGQTLTRSEVIALRDKLSEWLGDGPNDAEFYGVVGE